MASLFVLNKEYLDLLDLIEDEEIDEEVIRDTLESIESEWEDKLDKMANVITEIEGRIAVRDKEIERLKAANKTDANSIEKIKRLIFSSMELHKKQKFQTATHKFGIANNGGVLPLVFVGGEPKGEHIPEAFRKEKKDYTVDTEKIRNLLDKGLELEWVHYGERGRSLRIK